MEADVLVIRYEIAYAIEEAKTGRLSLSLPEETPAQVSIQAIDGGKIKESNSHMEGKRRRWEVLLEEPRCGTVRLAVDFQQPLAIEKSGSISVPMVRAEGVAYQSGLVAVEGGAELDVQVSTDARRVDVGELAEAAYQPGRRLLGAFGFVGEPAPVKVSVTRHRGYGLQPAIVEKAVLKTNLSAHGVSQTTAIFSLRSKVNYLEVLLPAESELWSAFVDDKPIKPQTESGRILVSLPSSQAAVLHTLRITYQTRVAAISLTGHIELPAPNWRWAPSKTHRPRKCPWPNWNGTSRCPMDTK